MRCQSRSHGQPDVRMDRGPTTRTPGARCRAEAAASVYADDSAHIACFRWQIALVIFSHGRIYAGYRHPASAEWRICPTSFEPPRRPGAVVWRTTATSTSRQRRSASSLGKLCARTIVMSACAGAGIRVRLTRTIASGRSVHSVMTARGTGHSAVWRSCLSRYSSALSVVHHQTGRIRARCRRPLESSPDRSW